MEKMKTKKNEGITLIALVITIIVLLILAGVSIAMLTGQNGILTQTNNAKIEQSHAAVKDSIALLYNEYQIQINTGSITKLASTETVQIPGKEEKILADTSLSFIEFLQGQNSQNKNYLKGDSIINVEALTGSRQALGNGTDTDIYKIEEENGSYVVYYYNADNQKEKIWNVNINDTTSSELVPTREDFFTFDEETGTITGVVENTSKDPNGIGVYYDGHTNILSESNIVIPEKIKGITVTSIGANAFDMCSNLTSVTIPDSVTSIGNCAFSDTGLTSITIPDSVTSIGAVAFSKCRSLTSITIPKSVTSIGNYAFSDTGLTSITIPDSVTSIGDSAFTYSYSLTSVTLPDSVTSIGNYAFSHTGLTSITIPDSVTNIGIGVFEWSELTSATIPGSVTSIGDRAFGSTDLTSITIPDGVKSIGEEAFGWCYKLTSVTLPDSVTSIGDSAFDGCDKLTSIVIGPESTLTIPEDKWGATNANVTTNK